MIKHKHECPACGKKLKSQQGVHDHMEAKHMHNSGFDRDAFECIAADLPDGAYFAMAEEMGVDLY